MEKINVEANTVEMDKILAALENMEDEQQAVELLREFNEKSAELKNLLLNKDPSLDHNIWKMECDLANREFGRIIKKILGPDQ